MKAYNLKIKNIEALYRYIAFLETFEFQGEILTRSENADAKDILFICDKLFAKELWLRIEEGDQREIEKYLYENELL